jgi:hypothetical protein
MPKWRELGGIITKKKKDKETPSSPPPAPQVNQEAERLAGEEAVRKAQEAEAARVTKEEAAKAEEAKKIQEAKAARAAQDADEVYAETVFNSNEQDNEVEEAFDEKVEQQELVSELNTQEETQATN